MSEETAVIIKTPFKWHTHIVYCNLKSFIGGRRIIKNFNLTISKYIIRFDSLGRKFFAFHNNAIGFSLNVISRLLMEVLNIMLGIGTVYLEFIVWIVDWLVLS